ncbi:hypothetical protein SO802_034050 [Lithocarpus litseifolius]|uniref:Phytocyanin domain-containing protein n=1 Tax=Lithocarpus litseifolius TaxID=425828 RepID=A0AAW2BK92_9ROSI
MASTQFFIFAILAVLVPSIFATDFVVGDDKGWTTGFDYETWAAGKEFHVGDQLEEINFLVQFFKYQKGNNNVLNVNGTGFQQCVAPAGTVPLTSGNDVIPLAASGRKWYICGVPTRCANGKQKLAITVLDGLSPAPSPKPSRGSVAPVHYWWNY